MKSIIYENKNGGLAWFTPSLKRLAELHGTELQKMEFLAKRNVPKIQDWKDGPEEIGEDGEPFIGRILDGEPYYPEYEIVEHATLKDKTFRDAWKKLPKGMEVNLDLAKGIAHGMRREKRGKLMLPFDEVISKNIPGEDSEIAESNRATIRIKDAAVQEDIEGSGNAESLTTTIVDYQSFEL